MGTPLVLTTHSLGRQKKQHLIAQGGVTDGELELKYSFSERIEAEEEAFDHATITFGSTSQELRMQCGMYSAYRTLSSRLVFPGVNIPLLPDSHNQPGLQDVPDQECGLINEVTRFLKEPQKPAVLLIARPVVQKNAIALIQAFASSAMLREKSNLILILGQRHKLWCDPTQGLKKGTDPEQQDVMLRILSEIDNLDLYGSVAYPKKHARGQVAELYAWVARQRGVFVNCSLGEPFGLTLLEAAAHGLPVAATTEGGPADIVRTLANGTLVNPRQPLDIARGIEELLFDDKKWDISALNGKKNVHKFTWEAHTEQYIGHLQMMLRDCNGGELARDGELQGELEGDGELELELELEGEGEGEGELEGALEGEGLKLLVCDLDHTLLGPSGSLPDLLESWNAFKASQDDLSDPSKGTCGMLVVATGRDLMSAKSVLKEHRVQWDVIIANGGTEIWHAERKGSEYVEERVDESFGDTVAYGWDRGGIEATLGGVRGLRLQPEANQTPRKVGYYMEDYTPPPQDLALALALILTLNLDLIGGCHGPNRSRDPCSPPEVRNESEACLHSSPFFGCPPHASLKSIGREVLGLHSQHQSSGYTHGWRLWRRRLYAWRRLP